MASLARMFLSRKQTNRLPPKRLPLKVGSQKATKKSNQAWDLRRTRLEGKPDWGAPMDMPRRRTKIVPTAWDSGMQDRQRRPITRRKGTTASRGTRRTPRETTSLPVRGTLRRGKDVLMIPKTPMSTYPSPKWGLTVCEERNHPESAGSIVRNSRMTQTMPANKPTIMKEHSWKSQGAADASTPLLLIGVPATQTMLMNRSMTALRHSWKTLPNQEAADPSTPCMSIDIPAIISEPSLTMMSLPGTPEAGKNLSIRMMTCQMRMAMSLTHSWPIRKLWESLKHWGPRNGKLEEGWPDTNGGLRRSRRGNWSSSRSHRITAWVAKTVSWME